MRHVVSLGLSALLIFVFTARCYEDRDIAMSSVCLSVRL